MTLPTLTPEHIWLSICFFFMRFFVQWLASEKEGKSVIPQSFWYFSILGSLTLLIYAIWRKDPVIMLGQSVGFFIYFRNLYFIYSKDKVTLPDSTNTTPNH